MNLSVKRSVLLLAMSFLTSGCHAFNDKTAAVVTVLEVHQNKIVIQDYSGEIKTVASPPIIEKLVEGNKEYFVEYEYNWVVEPTLVSIEPAEEKTAPASP